MAEKLIGDKRAEALAELPGWAEDGDNDAIARTFIFADFNEAFGFMTRAALGGELKGLDEAGDAGAVDVAHLGKIDEDSTSAADAVEKNLARLRRMLEVYFSFERNDEGFPLVAHCVLHTRAPLSRCVSPF